MTSTEPKAAPGPPGRRPRWPRRPGGPAAGRDSAQRAKLRQIVNSLSVAGGLIVLIIIFAIASPYFVSTGNIYRIFQQVAVVAVLAVGQSFVIFTAGIDLSQGSVLAVAAVGGGMVMVSTGNIAYGILAALVIGLIAGVISGLFITVIKLPPFIATLAMLGMAGGAALLVTNGQPVFGFPSGFSAFGSSGIYVFPFIVIVAAVVAAYFQFFSNNTRTGRYIFAIGSNERAARVAGIRSPRVIVAVYALSGILAGLAAVLEVAYVDSAQPSMHTRLLLDAIAAVVIGGASLAGGEGSIWGSMIGALLIAVLDNGTELLGISTYIQTILLGVVVVIAVGIDNLRRRERVTA
jgi:ribose/xylose/arabinose/galactoside ABC-type transport system permease subunit